MSNAKLNVYMQMRENLSKELPKISRKFKRMTGAATREFSSLSKRILSVKSALVGFAGAAGIGLSVRGLYNLVDSVSEVGDKIAKLEDRLGLSTDFLQEMAFAAERTGVSVDGMYTGFQRATRRIADAVTTQRGPVHDLFKQLDIDLKDSTGNIRDLESVLPQLADQFAQMSDSERVSSAFKLFDTEGVSLVQMLQLGSGEIENLLSRFRELGGTMSEELIAASEKYRDSLTDLHWAFLGIKNDIAEELLPSFTTLNQVLTDFIVSNKDFLTNALSGLGDPQNLKDMGSGFLTTIGVITDGLKVIQSTYYAIETVFSGLSLLVIGVAGLIVDSVNGIVKAFQFLTNEAKIVSGSVELQFTKMAKAIVDNLKTFAGGLREQLDFLQMLPGAMGDFARSISAEQISAWEFGLGVGSGQLGRNIESKERNLKSLSHYEPTGVQGLTTTSDFLRALTHEFADDLKDGLSGVANSFTQIGSGMAWSEDAKQRWGESFNRITQPIGTDGELSPRLGGDPKVTLEQIAAFEQMQERLNSLNKDGLQHRLSEIDKYYSDEIDTVRKAIGKQLSARGEFLDFEDEMLREAARKKREEFSAFNTERLTAEKDFQHQIEMLSKDGLDRQIEELRYNHDTEIETLRERFKNFAQVEHLIDLKHREHAQELRKISKEYYDTENRLAKETARLKEQINSEIEQYLGIGLGERERALLESYSDEIERWREHLSQKKIAQEEYDAWYRARTQQLNRDRQEARLYDAEDADRRRHEEILRTGSLYDGLREGLHIYRDELPNAAELGFGAMTDSLRGFQDATEYLFEGLIMNTREWKDSFRQAGIMILQVLARVLAQLIAVQIVSAFLGGFGGSKGNSGSANLPTVSTSSGPILAQTLAPPTEIQTYTPPIAALTMPPQQTTSIAEVSVHVHAEKVKNPQEFEQWALSSGGAKAIGQAVQEEIARRPTMRTAIKDVL